MENFKLEDYFTKERAGKGIKVPLELPNGEPTSDYLIVVGTESARYQEARADAERELLIIMSGPEEGRNALIYNEAVKICAHCVIGWSFEVECTFDNVYQLLSNSRYIKTLVDSKMGSRTAFFGQGSTD